MKYVFNKQLSTHILEDELGLKRGDVIRIDTDAEGNTKVFTKAKLSKTQKEQLDRFIGAKSIERTTLDVL